MRGKKQLRKMKQLLCLLLAVILVCGAVSLESVLAVESETTQETEAQTGETVQEPEAQTEETVQEPETESVKEDSESEETEPTVGAETDLSTNTEPDKYANRISGVLWIDANEDGTYDSSEQALAGYPVYLYSEGDTDDAVVDVTTDADGRYLFENIEPGRYVVGIKAEENGTEYLLPLMGVQNDNKFYFTPDWSMVVSDVIEIEADMAIVDVDAAMRTMPGIEPMAAYSINIGTVSADGTGYTYASNVLTFTTDANNHTYTITGSTTSKRIIVNTGVTLNVTLDNASITNSVSPIIIRPGSSTLDAPTVNMTITGTNVLRCTRSAMPVESNSDTGYTAGIYVTGNSTSSQRPTLTISGTGSLTATGGWGGAGIGSGAGWGFTGITHEYMGGSAIHGNIRINSGTVTATGGFGAAGIGIGYYNNAATDPGTIRIAGGTVVANGGSGGYAGNDGTIGGAGIGAGNNPVTGKSNITITGGRVTATSGGTTSPGIGHSRPNTNDVNFIGSVVFTGGSILANTSSGTSRVYPLPTNGSTNGAPDTVTRRTISSSTHGKEAGSSYRILAVGTIQSYNYNMLIHDNGNAYPWVASYTLLAPTATTSAATSITATGATLNGTHNTQGLSGTVYFQYGTSSTLATSTTVGSATATSSSATSKAQALTGLTPGTTYYFRIVTETVGGTTYGSILNFTTSTPAATTTTASSVTGISASLNGTYNTGGVSGTVQFEYGTTSGLTTYTTVNATTLTSSAATTRTYSLTGLTPATTYYYRMVVIVSGTRYTGIIRNFTTSTPTAASSAASTVTSSSAVLNGTYNTAGYAGTVAFEYGTDASLSTYTAVDSASVNVSTSTNKTYTLTGLTDTTIYYFRIVTIVNGVRYEGNIESFETLPPYVDLAISKTVTGAYADLTKAFSFTVYFQDSTGAALANGTTFSYTGGTIPGSSVTAPADDTLMLDNEGKATVTLSHGQTVTIAGVSTSGKVQIVETTDANYTTSFIDSAYPGAIIPGADTNVCGMTGADRTFDFTNARIAVTPAGISTGGNALILLALLAVMTGLASTVVYRRRRREG